MGSTCICGGVLVVRGVVYRLVVQFDVLRSRCGEDSPASRHCLRLVLAHVDDFAPHVHCLVSRNHKTPAAEDIYQEISDSGRAL